MEQGGYGGHPFPMHGAPAPQQYASGGPPSYLQPPPPIQFTYHPLPFAGFPPPTPPQLHPHPPPPHIPTVSFFNPWEPTPHFAPPPPDIELHKRIDKLVEYAAKNGPEFENMLKEKQRDNPAYAFLFGAEGYHYYRYKLWISVNAHLNAFNPSIPPHINPPPLNTPSFSSLPSPLSLPTPPPPIPSVSPFPPFYETAPPLSHHQLPPQNSQTFFQHDSFSDSDTKPFKGLSGPLPADVATELNEVLENLTGTKESIKGAKTWFMQRSPFAPALAEALKDRVLALDDAERQLHVIYLANDILFDSLQRRGNIKELDNEALAFQPVLGSMLGAICHNFQNQEANQTRLQKILQFWAAKEVYSTNIINNLEAEMIAGPSPQPRPCSPKPSASAFQPSSASGLSLPSTAATTGQVALQTTSKWQAEQPRTSEAQAEQLEQEQQPTFSAAISSAQFTLTSQPLTANPVTAVYSSVAVTPSFIGSLPIVTPIAQPALAQLPTVPSMRSIEHPPYPLFPPGLIPGMVRKMQIGSGVPYSPLSPLDIPTVIPPSTVSDAYILERVAKYFKDIGEIDPLDGQSNARGRDAEDDIEEERGRSGGARIPPPPNLQVDAETNTLADGSMEHKPGSTSSGRLGLGATADPNEVTQYDDVYTSYRKQRSTNYHTTMSARAAAR